MASVDWSGMDIDAVASSTAVMAPADSSAMDIDGPSYYGNRKRSYTEYATDGGSQLLPRVSAPAAPLPFSTAYTLSSMDQAGAPAQYRPAPPLSRQPTCSDLDHPPVGCTSTFCTPAQLALAERTLAPYSPAQHASAPGDSGAAPIGNARHIAPLRRRSPVHMEAAPNAPPTGGISIEDERDDGKIVQLARRCVGFVSTLASMTARIAVSAATPVYIMSGSMCQWVRNCHSRTRVVAVETTPNGSKRRAVEDSNRFSDSEGRRAARSAKARRKRMPGAFPVSPRLCSRTPPFQHTPLPTPSPSTFLFDPLSVHSPLDDSNTTINSANDPNPDPIYAKLPQSVRQGMRKFRAQKRKKQTKDKTKSPKLLSPQNDLNKIRKSNKDSPADAAAKKAVRAAIRLQRKIRGTDDPDYVDEYGLTERQILEDSKKPLGSVRYTSREQMYRDLIARSNRQLLEGKALERYCRKYRPNEDPKDVLNDPMDIRNQYKALKRFERATKVDEEIKKLIEYDIKEYVHLTGESLEAILNCSVLRSTIRADPERSLGEYAEWEKKLEKARRKVRQAEDDALRKAWAESEKAAQRREEKAARAKKLEQIKAERKKIVPKSARAPLIQTLSQERSDSVWKAMKYRNKDQVLSTSMTGVELTRKDFGTLLARTSQEISHEWLNDEIVNAFMSAIVENRKAHDKYDKESGKAPALAAFQTGWYNTWKSRGVSGIARWSRRMGIKGNKLLGAEHIFFPINSGVHWTLLLISPKSRTINHLDSMGSKSGEMLQFAREWLRMELGDAYVASEWTVAKGSSSRQDNSDDCGVFACFNALAVAEKRSFEDVTAEQMQDARKMLAALLLDPLAWREFGLTH